MHPSHLAPPHACCLLQDALAVKSREQLQKLAERDGYGPLFSAFGTVAEGLRACDAVDSLVDASAIDTLLSNFIVPLQSDDISKPDPSGGWVGGTHPRYWCCWPGRAGLGAQAMV